MLMVFMLAATAAAATAAAATQCTHANRAVDVEVLRCMSRLLMLFSRSRVLFFSFFLVREFVLL